MGVPRSNGCLLCVQRHVKCDEGLPGCARCAKYGRPCPGYGRGFKFVTGKPYRSRRHQGSKTAEDDTDLAEGSSGKASQAMQQSQARRASSLWLMSANTNVMQSLEILIGDVSHPFPASSTYTTARWFTFLPSIYGRNRTLDSSIRCFVAHHIGTMAGNKQAIMYARSTYVEALNRLQRSLYNPRESLSSEILCAVLLQCFYELFANAHDSTSWIKHAKGLSQLVRFRGCDRYQTEFDHTLLKASRGLIIMHSLFSKEKCFLASGDWQSVMKQQLDSTLPTIFHAQVEELFALYTTIPCFIHQFFDLRQAEPAHETTQFKACKLLNDALAMQARLITWYDSFSHTAPLPTEVLSSMGDTLYPVVYSFTDIDTATIFAAYYSYMVIVHAILGVCHYPGEHAAMVAYYRDQICMSVEYLAQGILGPSRLGFPLLVVNEFADPPTKLWVQGWLQRLSETYKVMLPQNYER
ncbi:C6 zinc finger domain protein [Aspergillus pseudotamarii]|uniref:C6 zinc finger domain protein n=1 Tax=Aspergillus pseudotamarii TaxID=132259 RepID=A0A5N6SRY1_ASPPS|nr:C6 zinc finger domain protein [Aspergillus pseudotamarii]KAE8136520.1 C6 zinc finger domain protein [Aspergillus pseudotamarii]